MSGEGGEHGPPPLSHQHRHDVVSEKRLYLAGRACSEPFKPTKTETSWVRETERRLSTAQAELFTLLASTSTAVSHN